MKQAVCQGRRQQSQHVVPARRLAKDGYIAWITAERLNICLHPLKRLNNVEVPKVGGGIKARFAALNRGVCKPAQRAQTVVEGHNDDVFTPNELVEVIEALVARGVAATVNPEHHGFSTADGTFLRFYIHIQAVLCSNNPFAGHTARIVSLLNASHGVPCVAYGLCRYDRVGLAVWPRRLPSQLSDGGLRVRDISIS